MSRETLQSVFAGSVLVLTVASFWVLSGAVDEPFVHFRASEALVQVGVGSVLMLLWLQLSVGICWAAWVRRVSRWWLLLLIWCAAGFMAVQPSPFGYVQDITRFVVQKP